MTDTVSDSTTVRAPSLPLFLTEAPRGFAQLSAYPLAAPWLARAPRDNPHGVLVLPGFLATDSSTQLLRRYLRGLGHTVWGWRLGRNLGPTSSILDGMPKAVELLAERAGSPVSLVGWSLGGVFARELARRRPDLVRQVITLGSPFALRDPLQSRAGRAFQRQAHRHVVGTGPSAETAQPIPVPSTAVYSKRDGIVHWRSCIEPQTDRHRNVQVRCAHLGFGMDPATFWLVADRLAKHDPGASPFVPPALLRVMYPAPD
ncbi:esterase/lipase family protein [uncultured Jatrophihabitans sp.]|uniref:esterase/lipase family protein n=1 Tax=uncultured Jatrophihabitans sp. TaxID=1610747 RepID=UPI0035C9C8A3